MFASLKVEKQSYSLISTVDWGSFNFQNKSLTVIFFIFHTYLKESFDKKWGPGSFSSQSV